MSAGTDWYPCGLLNEKPQNAYGIIILNQLLNHKALKVLIKNAAVIVCADAGADQYYALKEHQSGQEFARLPDAIVGDLDSITPEVKEHYRSQSVEIAHDPDQYATDFTKSLKWLRQWCRKNDDSEKVLDVVVLGGLGGRVDQAFSQIHHLYMAARDPELLNGRIFLLSERSLSFVLGDGSNRIHLESGYFCENVGIIPVLGSTKITTRGLEWDVEDWPTEFGGEVSTSNHIRSDLIVIDAGRNPLFTLELEDHLALA